MKRSKFLIFTLCSTLAYCFICFLSAGSILFGAYNDKHSIFEFGNRIIYFWLINPLGILMPIIGLFIDKPKRFFLLCMLLVTVSWWSALIMIASIF